jgi:tetratricopeptide (TPR) repeat protein
MEGRFSFTELPPNLYHVIVDDPNFEPLRVNAVISSIAAQATFVQVDLKPVKKADDRAPDSTPSGGNPNMVDKDAIGGNLPKDAVKAFEKGVKLSAEGKTDEAIEKFEHAIEIAPAFYQGSSFLSKGDFAAAQAQFEEVIKVQQADAAAYFNLGNVYLMTNRAEDSYRAIQAGLKREPTSAKGQFLLGTLYARTGRVAEAEQQLQNVLQLDPTISKAHLELANIYLRQNERGQAIHELNTFLSRFPDDPMAPKVREVLARLTATNPKP